MKSFQALSCGYWYIFLARIRLNLDAFLISAGFHSIPLQRLRYHSNLRVWIVAQQSRSQMSHFTQFVKDHRLPIGIAMGVAFLGLLFFFPPTPQVKGAKVVGDMSLEKLGVIAQASIDAVVLEHGESTSYSIVVYNTASSELQNLRVSLNAPGFSIEDDMSQGNNTPEQKAMCFPKVPAGTSVKIDRRLRAITRSGQYRITASYQATRQNLVLHSAVSVGPVQADGWFGQAMWVRFGKRAASLTLPFVLAVLAYLFQNHQAKRDQESQDAQKSREQRQGVRNIILPFFQALAEKHYMPIVSILARLIGDFSRWKNEKDKEQKEVHLKECFYDVVIFLRRMTFLRKDKGQVFFQNWHGEQVVSSAWTVARRQCQAWFQEVGIDSLIGETDGALPGKTDGAQAQFIDMDYASFVKVLGEGKWRAQFEQFSDWVTKNEGDFIKFLNLMNVLQAVFQYECNRPFNEYWYEDSEIVGLEFREFPGYSSDPRSARDFPAGNQYHDEIEKFDKYWPMYKESVDETNQKFKRRNQPKIQGI